MKKVNKEVVDVLKKYLKQNNISQKELSKISGISESNISKIFNYDLTLRLDSLYLICDALNLDFDTLLSTFQINSNEDAFNLLLNQILVLKSKLNDHEKCILIKTLVED